NISGSMVLFSHITLFGGLRVVLGAVYVHPDIKVGGFVKLLAKLEHALSRLDELPVVLVGDFNIRHAQLGDSTSAGHASRFLKFLDRHALTVLNVRDCWGLPTREKSGSVLDLAITNRPELFTLKIGRFPVCSDHSSLTLELKVPDGAPVAAAPMEVPRWSHQLA